MKIMENETYHIDNYTDIKCFIEEVINEIKSKKLNGIYSNSYYCSNSTFTEKIFATDGNNYIVFDDESVIKFSYNFFSIIDIKFTNIKKLEVEDLKVINNNLSMLDLNCLNVTIVDYEIERFNDAYIIDPINDKTRPHGGDYFKEIILHLNNGKKLCICAENAEFDGWCDIWIENNSTKNVFHSQDHKIWWV